MSAFKGIWIPADLLKRQDLTPNEKFVLGYCASFEKCFASDRHIAESIGMNEGTLRNILTGLRKKGIVNGRNFPKSFTTCHESVIPCHESVNIDISREISLEQSKDVTAKLQIVKPDVFSELTPQQQELFVKHWTHKPFGAELRRCLEIALAKEKIAV